MLTQHNMPENAGSQRRPPKLATCLALVATTILVIIGACALVFPLATVIAVAGAFLFCCFVVAASCMKVYGKAYRSTTATLKKLSPHYSPVACDITVDFAHCDLSPFNAIDAEYQRLGFQRLADVRETWADGSTVDGFQRMYHHPDWLCFGSVSFFRAADAYLCRFGIITFFTEDWQLSSTNSIPLSLQYGISQPRNMICYLPQMSPAALAEYHHQACASLANQAHLSPVDEGNYRYYQAAVARSVAERHALIQKRGYVSLFLAALFLNGRLPTIWLGELQGKVTLPDPTAPATPQPSWTE